MACHHNVRALSAPFLNTPLPQRQLGTLFSCNSVDDICSENGKELEAVARPTGDSQKVFLTGYAVYDEMVVECISIPAQSCPGPEVGLVLEPSFSAHTGFLLAAGKGHALVVFVVQRVTGTILIVPSFCASGSVHLTP